MIDTPLIDYNHFISSKPEYNNCFVKNSRINNSVNCRLKASISASLNSGPKQPLSAFFFPELQKCFQSALLLMCSLTILGTESM